MTDVYQFTNYRLGTWLLPAQCTCAVEISTYGYFIHRAVSKLRKLLNSSWCQWQTTRLAAGSLFQCQLVPPRYRKVIALRNCVTSDVNFEPVAALTRSLSRAVHETFVLVQPAPFPQHFRFLHTSTRNCKNNWEQAKFNVNGDIIHFNKNNKQASLWLRRRHTSPETTPTLIIL